MYLFLERSKCGSRAETRRWGLYASDTGCWEYPIPPEKVFDKNVGYPSFSRHFFGEFLQKNVRLKRPPFPIGNFHFQSENDISGLKILLPVWKCVFRSESCTSSRKAALPNRKYHFQPEYVFSNEKNNLEKSPCKSIWESRSKISNKYNS